jgi:hypothetical protein
MFELAKRVADRSPPLNSTSTPATFAMLITLSVIAFTSSREYIGVQGFRGSRVPGFRGSGVPGFRNYCVLHGQLAPPAPQPPDMGTDVSRRGPFEVPTIPGLDNCFTRFAPWQAGHSAALAAVTNASK